MNKLLRLGVTVALLTLIAWKTNWPRVVEAFSGLRGEFWLAAVGVLLTGQIVSAWRWQLFAERLGFTRSVRELTHLYLIGMYFNLILPTAVGGDVVRAWYVSGASGRRLAAFVSVFLDRVSGLVVLVALACVGVLLCPAEVPLPAWIPWTMWAIAATGVCAVCCVPIAARWRRLNAGRREQLQALWRTMREPRLLLSASLLSLYVQTASVVILWLVARALHTPVPLSYLWILVPMVSLLTMLPVSIGGHGVREGAMVLLLAPLGVDRDTALTLSLLWFAVSMTCGLLGGVVYLLRRLPRPDSALANEVSCGSVDSDPDQGRTGQPAKAA